MSFNDFKKQSTKTNVKGSVSNIEKKFWDFLEKSDKTNEFPMYGSGIEKSLCPKKQPYWNFQQLGSLLSNLKDISGINKSWLYLGSYSSLFIAHCEDYDFPGINFLHSGKSKIWYGVPPAYHNKFEEMCQNIWPEQFKKCPAFLRHKEFMVAPHILKENGVPYYRVEQKEGEIVVVAPSAYHFGFNSGWNIAEAVNFANLRWLPFGEKAVNCHCKIKYKFSDKYSFEDLLKGFGIKK